MGVALLIYPECQFPVLLLCILTVLSSVVKALALHGIIQICTNWKGTSGGFSLTITEGKHLSMHYAENNVDEIEMQWR